MPLHDWTTVGPGTFHAFHTRWITHLSDALNKGILPPGYYSDPEQHLGRKIADALRRTLAVRHTSNHRIIALIEILSPGNKASEADVDQFVRKAKDALASGIHLSVIDLLPPGEDDPNGIHAEILKAISHERYELPEGKPLTFVAYSAGSPPVAYLQHPAIGDPVPKLPLFLTVGDYIDLPLATTYETAWEGVSAFWREVIEGRREHL